MCEKGIGIACSAHPSTDLEVCDCVLAVAIPGGPTSGADSGSDSSDSSGSVRFCDARIPSELNICHSQNNDFIKKNIQPSRIYVEITAFQKINDILETSRKLLSLK